MVVLLATERVLPTHVIKETIMTTTPSRKPVDLTTIQSPLHTLHAIETELCHYLLEREDAIRAGLLALLTRQHLVLIGPAGTAKSLLVTELAKRI